MPRYPKGQLSNHPPLRSEEEARADVLAEEVKRIRNGTQTARIAIIRLVSHGWRYSDAHRAINTALREGGDHG